MKEIEEIRNIFQKLPKNNLNFGLIHGDFELDNIFYNESSKKCSIIDFGSSKYHWYIMDIEIADNTVLQLLRNLASMSLIRFTPEIPSQDDLITARLNEIYNEVDSSLEPCYMMAQAEVLSEDW